MFTDHLFKVKCNDESPLVRGTTLDVIGEINNKEYINYFLHLLNNSKRTLRIKAFFAVAGLTETPIPEIYKGNLYCRLHKK